MIPLHLRGGIDVPRAVDDPAGRLLPKVPLDTVVDSEIYRPRRKIPKDGRSEATVHAAKTVMLEDVFDGRWGWGGGEERRRTLSGGFYTDRARAPRMVKPSPTTPR